MSNTTWKKQDTYRRTADYTKGYFYRRIGEKWVRQNTYLQKAVVAPTINNLLSFSGQYYIVYIDSTTVPDEIAAFEKGECPLTFSTYHSDDNIGGGGFVIQVIYLNADIKAGSHIDFTYIFPTASITDASYNYKRFRIGLRSNEEGDGWLGLIEDSVVYNDYDNGEICISTYETKLSKNLTCEMVCDINGSLVGMRAYGTLDHSLDRISLLVDYFGLPKYEPCYGTMTTTFKSHDDFTLIVT